MKAFKKKALSLVLIAALTASMLAGCGKKDGDEAGVSGGGKSGGKGTVATDSAASKEGVWKGQPLNLGIEGDFNIQKTVVNGDKVTLLIQTYEYTDNGYKNEYKLVTMNKDGSGSSLVPLEGTLYEQIYSYKDDEEGEWEDGDGEMHILEDEPAEATEANAVGAAPVAETAQIFPVSEIGEDGETEKNVTYRSVQNVGLTNSGEAMGLIYEEVLLDEQTYQYEYDYTVTAWNADGSIKWQKPFGKDGDQDTYMWVSYAAALSNGNYILIYSTGNDTNGIVYNTEGEEVKKAKLESDTFNSLTAIVTTPDGKDMLVYYTWDEVNYSESYKTAILNPETLEISDERDVLVNLGTSGLYQVSSGAGMDIVFMTNAGIFGFNRNDTEAKKVMDYINSDLAASYMNQIAFVDDTHFIGVYSDIETYDAVVAMFTYVDPSTIPDRTTLLLACNNLDWDLRNAVLKFNKENGSYRITIKDYSEYSTWEDWYGSITQLNNDILAGKTPDILYVSDLQELDPGVYANKGLLADVEDLIKNDAELSQNEYLSNVMDLYRYNGKSVVVIPSFSYNTVIGLDSEFGSKKGWSAEEFMNYAKSLSPDQSMFEDFTRSSFMSQVMQYCGSDFIDVATGKCDFNNETFINLLKFAQTLPEEIQYDDDYWNDYDTFFSSGRIKLTTYTISSLQSYNNFRWYRFMAPATNVGFPTSNGNGGVLEVYTGMMLFAKSANLDGAWQFCRQYLTKDYQDSLEYNIPVLKSSFDKWAQKGAEQFYWENENGEKEYYDNYYTVDGQEYPIPVMTQEDIDAVKQDIMSCNTVAYRNESILSIIEEELSALYSGAKSAEDVAAIIQSRVQIYVSENQK